MQPSILLHVCCGPCAIWPVRHLASEGFCVTGFFYNPNIQPVSEYLQRRQGANSCFDILNTPIEFNDDWDLEKWLAMQNGRWQGEERCKNCISQRLAATAARAKASGIPFFSTSLLYSRYQPHEFIREKGERIGKDAGVEFIYRDFRQYWQAGIDTSREWGLYRQKYCGCIFSEAERYAKKLKNLQKNNSASA